MTATKNGSKNGTAERKELMGIVDERVVIPASNMRTAEFTITGTAPYVQCRFSQKAIEQIRATQAAGSQAKSKKVREAKDFEAAYESSKHLMENGECGIPAGAFRQAMISACRLIGFKMTLAKLAVFVDADGFDVVDGTPLIAIIGKPEKHEMMGRNANGSVDLRVRTMFRQWSAKLRIKFDADVFSVTDVSNLLSRVGQQVGVGEGRPDSKNSCGLGWGTFSIQG